MQSEVIGTIEVLLLIVGLTELIKALGLEGRQVIVLAGSIGALLGGLSYAATEGVLVGQAVVWVRIVVGALWVGVKGLAAAGLVKFGVSRAQRVLTEALSTAALRWLKVDGVIRAVRGMIAESPLAPSEPKTTAQSDEEPEHLPPEVDWPRRYG